MMFDDNYEPTETDLKNPHLKEFIIKDDETAQRLIDAIEGASCNINRGSS